MTALLAIRKNLHPWHWAVVPCSEFDRLLLHLLTSGHGTEPLCAHVRIHGDYWRVSGLTADRTIKA